MAKITPKNLLKHNLNGKEEKKITLDNLAEMSSTDNVSDAMKNLYKTNGVVEGIKPISSSYKIVGRIRTAITDSGDWGTLIKAIYACNEDEILFVKCSDDTKAVWGEMASTAAKLHGLKGTIICGASRDTNEVIELDYPVFSKITRSNAGFALNEGAIGSDLFINDKIIKTGDVVFADCDGVVVIPQDKVDEVLAEVNNIKKFEDDCFAKIKKGQQLDEILNL